jgi:hypothetical protein
MKRNVLGLAAVVLAVAFSSFTAKKFATTYYVSSETSTAYNIQTTDAGTCTTGTKVCEFDYNGTLGSSISKTDFANLQSQGLITNEQDLRQ